MQTENLLSTPDFSEDGSSDDQTTKTTAHGILSALREQIVDWETRQSASPQKEPQPLRKLLSKNALFWGMPTSSVIHQPVIARLLSVKRKRAKSDAEFDFVEAATSWIRSIGESITIGNSLEAIAWAHAMSMLPERLGESTWTELLSHLLWLMDANGDASDEENAMVSGFLTSVELRLALARSLPEIPLCKASRKQAKVALNAMLDALLDGQGTLHAKNVKDIQYLLASGTRCLTLDAVSQKRRIGKSARLQFDWLVRQTLRWSRSNGSPILSDSLDSPHFDEMLKFALKITKDESDQAAFKALRGKRTTDDAEMPVTSEHSEWSELATMRTSWLPKANRLAVDYSDRSLNVELCSGRESILRGASDPHIVINDELLSLESDWQEVCWETDHDLDYLELECTLTHGWRLQRQFLLARHDKFILIADAIMGPTKSQIQYQHTLPTTDNITVEQEPENTEAAILGERKVGRIIPLALSEWRSEQRHDRLRQEPVRLEMSTSAVALYAPLFVDLEPVRRNKPLTWRQLTVAENLLPIPKDVAVAYRVQVGKAQWVIYRALGETGNRTFLGQNLISDFYVARFMPNGETQMLIDVQPS